VTNYASVPTLLRQFLANLAADRAAWYAIQQDQNSWSLATTQSKLNVIDFKWKEGIKYLKDKDKIDLLGL